MLLLYIDGKEAVIKDSSTFKLTRPNPIYSTQSDYTFDVTLPLIGCPQNQKIFGLLHYPYVGHTPLQGKSFAFHLLAPPIDLEGTAIVTQVTEANVKVQLLTKGEAASAPAETDGNKSDVYIDTLSLGYAAPWERFKNYVRDGKWESFWASLDKYKDAFRYTDIEGNIYYGTCIEFPFYRVKQWCRYPYVNAQGALKDDFWLEGITESGKIYVDDEVMSCGCHPGLLYMLQKVLEKAGYSVTMNVAENSWLWHIYILNVRGLDNFETMLPHWTVEDFVEQVRLFLNLQITYSGKKVAVQSAVEAMDSSSLVVLTGVKDEFTTDVDDEDAEQSDQSLTNIEYELPYADDIMLLPDDVWQYAEVITLSSYALITEYIRLKIPKTERSKSKWIFIDSSTDRAYAFLHDASDETSFALAEVDFLGPLIRHGRRADKDRTIDTKLKIVPCRMYYRNFKYYVDNKSYKDAYVWLPLPTDENAEYSTDYNIDKAINSDDSTTEEKTQYVGEKVDYIEVFYNPGELKQKVMCGTTEIDKWFPTVVGTPYVKNETTGYYLPITMNTALDPFRLNNRESSPSLLLSAYSSGAVINSGVVRNVTFTDNIACDPCRVYLIKGRRYVCQKLELTFDRNGLQPLKTGYFYEVN